MVQANSLNKVLVICGPTASGKTSLAIECAKKLNSEVISSDSMCIYKDCNIGTAKPTTEEMQGIKHHMIDVISPFDRYTVGDYRDAALPIIDKLLSEGKIPVICGGTGFYINSLLFDLSYGNAVGDNAIREKYEIFLDKFGKEELHKELEKIDPCSASKLHVNDTVRVIRALEIFEISGKRKSEILDDMTPRYDYKSFAISYPREELYDRIGLRVDIMMQDGLIDEIKALMDKGVDDGCQCMQGIGYKEVYAGLKNNATIEEISELIKFNTRHYAKRQITFFKRDERLEWLDKSDMNSMVYKIIEKIQ